MTENLGKLLTALIDAGAELIPVIESDDQEKLGALEEKKPKLGKEAVETFSQSRSVHTLVHGYATPSFRAALQDLLKEGVHIIEAADEDHEHPLAELKAKSPIAAKAIDAAQPGRQLCGWERWDRQK
ncbi:hypothetical protein MPC4_170104 [Methylocella tundrae]|uniref:Uncharacterized protein n=1 Tax=Methylocella tundrae TaxID=227605 RepID=A0A8B6M5D6_METTU|nr:hypothetical protein [Methylocella tundrae]VTZ25396.1 hypothetical protein MPC1_2270001 [Methylocella tundrae]VTZ49573.1 hypothetical protein MPC4_170104 [Methylocella tundrae]